jgi:tripartite-type tricarboxylate transporter receptor subunit TctC
LAAPIGTLVLSSNNIILTASWRTSRPMTDGRISRGVQLTKTSQILVVSPKLPVKTLKEYIAYGRANPGKRNWAPSGRTARSACPPNGCTVDGREVLLLPRGAPSSRG